MSLKMNSVVSQIRLAVLATIALMALMLSLNVLPLRSVGAQRRKATDAKASNPNNTGPVTPVTSCCGKKPPFKGIPNYGTSTYAGFTGQIAIATNHATAPNQPSLVIWDLTNQATAPTGVQWTVGAGQTNFYTHPDWTQAKIGDVGGITLDSSGNIYLAATRMYGFNNIGSSSIMPGNPGNGDVYKINGNTGTASRLVQTTPANTYTSGNKLPNTGPGLGQITLVCDYNVLLVSNFEDGKIYQIDPNTGNILGKYDFGQNLPSALPTSRPAMPDNSTNGYTQLGRRVWALKYSKTQGRVFFSVVSGDLGAPATPSSEIWSVAFGSGGFSGPAKLEVALPPLTTGGPSSSPVADITFDPTETVMYLAERSMSGGGSPAAHQSRLLEYDLVGLNWIGTSPTKFKIGWFSNHTNDAGGSAYDNSPGGRVWTTSDYITPTAVYGLQGLPIGGGDYLNSIDIDLNNTPGTGDKRWIGDVEIPCFQCDGGPPAPVIITPGGGCAKSGQYCITPTPGVTYTWNVTGGTPTTATGSCVNITWGSSSPKAITVTATNAAGCTAITRLALDDCPPPVDPCCPPWNKDLLKDMMFYAPSGSISAPYTLHFQPTAALKNSIQAYLDYMHSVNPAITMLMIDWQLHTGTYPTVGSPVGVTATTTWNYLGGGNFTTTGDPNFFSVPPFPMQVGNWYYISAVIHLPKGQTFFSDKCSDVGMWVRIQVIAAKRAGGGNEPVLEFSDGKTILKSLPISERRQQR